MTNNSKREKLEKGFETHFLSISTCNKTHTCIPVIWKNPDFFNI